MAAAAEPMQRDDVATQPCRNELHEHKVAVQGADTPGAPPRLRQPGSVAFAFERVFGQAKAAISVRVLGIDPGLTRCGIGVLEGSPGRPLHLVAVGVLRTLATAELGRRLVSLESQIEVWLDDYAPDAVAVERVFSQHNVRTVMGTAQASAVAITCAARRGLPVALHTPSEVKAAVTGNGRADKAQVTAMVTRLLRLDAPPKPADAADALALAACHVWRGGAQARIAAAAAALATGTWR